MHTRIFIAFAAAVFLTVAPADAADDEFVMVLNARNPTTTVSQAEVRAIYTGQRSFWHGVVPMKVFSRSPRSEASTGFIEGVLGTTTSRYEQDWASRQLSGQGIAPVPADSSEDVVASVAAFPGGIGFILASEAWSSGAEGIKIIEIE